MPAAIPEEDAVRVMLAGGARPLVPYPGARTPWKCRCLVCNAIIEPKYYRIKAGVGPCRSCGKAKAKAHAAGAMRIPEVEAVKIMLAAGFKPEVPYPGAKSPWLCLCLTCKELSTPRLTEVKRGTRCGVCYQKRRRRV